MRQQRRRLLQRLQRWSLVMRLILLSSNSCSQSMTDGPDGDGASDGAADQEVIDDADLAKDVRAIVRSSERRHQLPSPVVKSVDLGVKATGKHVRMMIKGQGRESREIASTAKDAQRFRRGSCC